MGRKEALDALKKLKEAKDKGVTRTAQLEEEEEEGDVYHLINEDEYGSEREGERN